MAKDIRVNVDDETHEEWSAIKGDENTWEDVIEVGIGEIDRRDSS